MSSSIVNAPATYGQTSLSVLLQWRVTREATGRPSFAVVLFTRTSTCLALQEVLQRLLADGHELGSHAHQHLLLTQLTPEQVEQQLVQAVKRITEVTGMASVPVS